MAGQQELEDTGERLIAKGNEQTLTYGEHISRYLSATQMIKGKAILDVASGSGYGTSVLAQYASHVTGLDYDQGAVDYAKKHYAAKNISFVCGDAEKMPFPDSSFDAVVSFETLEHLPHQNDFLREVKRVLKPGGLFAVSTPNDDEFIEGNVFHVHELDRAAFKALLKKYFKNIEYYYQATYYAAALIDENHMREAFDTTLRTHKTFEQQPTKAIYYLAVASDATLKPMESNVVLGDSWSAMREQEREGLRQNEKAELLKQLNELTEKYAITKNDAEKFEAQLAALYASRTWKTVLRAKKVVGIGRPHKISEDKN